MTSGARMLLQYCDVGVTPLGENALRGGPDGAPERIRGAASLNADRRPLGNSRLPASPDPALPGASYERAFCNIGSGAGHFAGKRDLLPFPISGATW